MALSMHSDSGERETLIWTEDSFFCSSAHRYRDFLPLGDIHFLSLVYNALCEVLADCEDAKMFNSSVDGEYAQAEFQQG